MRAQRTLLRASKVHRVPAKQLNGRRYFASTGFLGIDPRLKEFGPTFIDEYETLREKYESPKHPIVLCHGLLGFDKLKAPLLPFYVTYWRGVAEALTANGSEVITTSVPSTGSIEERAHVLKNDIEKRASGRTVHLIGHSMGGLDARYMISCLNPKSFEVASLTTIASPHRGSSAADFVAQILKDNKVPQVFEALAKSGLDLSTGAFTQLTTDYMINDFNPKVPDDPSVKYFSYGAAMEVPRRWNKWYIPYNIIYEKEGVNDGLVSVSSASWGEYKGSLVGPTHLDIINWSNRLGWLFKRQTFNAIAFYSDIGDMLAKEGF